MTKKNSKFKHQKNIKPTHVSPVLVRVQNKRQEQRQPTVITEPPHVNRSDGRARQVCGRDGQRLEKGDDVNE
jgi:hypothetical protein